MLGTMSAGDGNRTRIAFCTIGAADGPDRVQVLKLQTTSSESSAVVARLLPASSAAMYSQSQ